MRIVILAIAVMMANCSFDEFVDEFQKVYSSEKEYAKRKEIYKFNLGEIERHNLYSNSSWKLGVNQFTDLTRDEFISKIKGYKLLGRKSSSSLAQNILEQDFVLPEHVDWRSKGVVTDAKIQGHCGDCWAFSTIQTVESHLAIQTGKLLNLSEQFLTSCMPNPSHCDGTGGCNGATQTLGFEYLEKNGIVLESEFPYQSQQGKVPQCKSFRENQIITRIKGHVNLPSNDLEALMLAVATKGPIAITVDASSWFGYESGVFDGCAKDKIELNHAVQLVGYGTDSDSD